MQKLNPDAKSDGDVFRLFAAPKALDQQLSTFGRQAGILVHVHSVLSWKLLSSTTSASQSRTE
jgi:hypothetical protein